VPIIEAAQLRAGLRLESSPRDLIRDYLIQRVEHGAVKDRFDVVAALREAGLEVPRQGKDYLTAMDPETGDRWRLKGRLYAFDFQPGRFDRADADAPREGTPRARGAPRGTRCVPSSAIRRKQPGECARCCGGLGQDR